MRLTFPFAAILPLILIVPLVIVLLTTHRWSRAVSREGIARDHAQALHESWSEAAPLVKASRVPRSQWGIHRAPFFVPWVATVVSAQPVAKVSKRPLKDYAMVEDVESALLLYRAKMVRLPMGCEGPRCWSATLEVSPPSSLL